MTTIYDSRQRLKYIFITVAILIAIVSLIISDNLIKLLAQEERQKMEIWAEAIRMLNDAPEEESPNMNLVLKILQSNTTIPVILRDEEGDFLHYNNLNLSEETVDELRKKLMSFKHKRDPIILDFDGSFQFLYYDDSILLKRLLWYPYAQLTVMFLFIIIAFVALASTKKAEQNKVWVGLSKETAHQLGTPISSLIAWVEYLKTKDIEPSLLNELGKDVKRLETIAERFSKIGSSPDPEAVDLINSIQSAVSYMQTRISSKVKIKTEYPDKHVLVLMSDSLFAWVLENLIKNAVDAMGGQGEISIRVKSNERIARIDVADTGKGIPKSRFNTVFNPGYTTKARGWGLGLSLVKRIVESYHGGKIYVKSSELGKGTVFRIELRKYGE